jgi:hypothetical protein
MANGKQKMVTAVFRNRVDAQNACETLAERGYASSEINVLMSDATRSAYYPPTRDDERTHSAGNLGIEGAGVGGAIGTAVGATLAAIAAIGTSIAIPGLGLVVAGPLAAALAGGGAGAVAGGLIGGLIGLGIPEPDATAYLDALRNGGVVIGVVPHNSEDADRIKQDFQNHHGENVCYC